MSTHYVGVYNVAPCQDPKELVRAGWYISPCFFVPKAEKKRVSAAEWAAMPVEKRIKLLRLVIGSGGRFHYEFP